MCAGRYGEDTVKAAAAKACFMENLIDVFNPEHIEQAQADLRTKYVCEWGGEGQGSKRKRGGCAANTCLQHSVCGALPNPLSRPAP